MSYEITYIGAIKGKVSIAVKGHITDDRYEPEMISQGYIKEVINSVLKKEDAKPERFYAMILHYTDFTPIRA